MISTKGLTPEEKKEFKLLNGPPSGQYLYPMERARLHELRGKIIAASKTKVTTGRTEPSKAMPRKPMKRVSAKRAKESKEYAILAQQFLLEHSVCEACNQGEPSEQVHHKCRRGKYYLDVDTWLAVSNSCHHKIETSGQWARERGFIIDTHEKH